MQKQRLYSPFLLALGFFAAFVLGGFFIQAVFAGTWSPPTATPPAGNSEPPINTGPVSQVRSGDLFINNVSNTALLDTDFLWTDSLVSTGGALLGIIGGNVGIGTATPGTKLELGSGQFATPLGTAGAPPYTFKGDLDTGIWSSDPGTLNFSTNGSERVIIASNGNVGIGTVNPLTPLHIVSTEPHPVFIQSSSHEAMIEFSLLPDIDSGWEIGPDGDYFKFETLGPNGGNFPVSTRIIIKHNTGNVAIGKLDPGSDKLDVDGTAFASGGWQTIDADYAEWFEKEGDAAPGDIIGIDLKTGKARRYQPGDKFIGIYSTNAAYVANRTKETDEEMAKTHILVGLLGQLEFRLEQVIIEERTVKTLDGKEVGILLSDGKVLIGR